MTTQRERFILAVRESWAAHTPFPINEEEIARIKGWHSESLREAKKALAKIPSFATYEYGAHLAFWNFIEYEFLIDHLSCNCMANAYGCCPFGNVEMLGACEDPHEFELVEPMSVCSGGEIRQGEYTEAEIEMAHDWLVDIASETGATLEADYDEEDYVERNMSEFIDGLRQHNYEWLYPMCKA